MGVGPDATVAMSDDDPDRKSIGTWVPEDSASRFDDFDLDALEEFDETLKRAYDGTYSRSEHMRRAMLLYLKVHQRWAKLEEWDRPDSARALALEVTSAMRTAYTQDVGERGGE